ncbi:MAG: hypothetical protein NW200_08860, partial [Hyphomonadaceae bacterium]|nr:hypothetical protein [Hyphomonadaceae bacterium]
VGGYPRRGRRVDRDAGKPGRPLSLRDAREVDDHRLARAGALSAPPEQEQPALRAFRLMLAVFPNPLALDLRRIEWQEAVDPQPGAGACSAFAAPAVGASVEPRSSFNCLETPPPDIIWRAARMPSIMPGRCPALGAANAMRPDPVVALSQ